MANDDRRLRRIDRKEVLRLQDYSGLNDEQLARAAGISVVTLKKWLKGKGAFLSKITKLAEALRVTPDRIIAAPGKALNATGEAAESHVFEMTIKLKGRLADPRQAVALTQATESLLK